MTQQPSSSEQHTPIPCSTETPCIVCGATDKPCYWSPGRLLCNKGGKVPKGFRADGQARSKQFVYVATQPAKSNTKPTELEEELSEKGQKPRLFQEFELIQARLGDRLRYNLLTKSVELDGQPFDLGIAKVELVISWKMPLKSGREDIADLVAKVAKQSTYSPVVEYLESCHQRFGKNTSILEGLASRYFGTDEPIYQALVQRFLIAAVARAYQPGCKVDTVLILQGKQGVGKSSFFRVLAGQAWFDDSLGSITDKDSRLVLHQNWMIEWAELESVFKRRDLSHIKAFLSCPVDQIRKPYGRSIESLRRSSVIVGTTNQFEFLADPTGNRRFWVLPVFKPIDLRQLEAERDQIWAAATEL
ncbi:VapE domain-containing protein [Leptolyngbya sp. AN02str]|uniref:VapE domain-containing protein n=1 Tax=Leptolyngbya sp. AN02str TaxID=3423363 RepID=UPI003D31F13E